MRKLFTLFFVLATFIVAKSETIYSVEFDTQEAFDSWTVIDNNGDEKTWIFSESNEPGRKCYYSYSYTDAADDWMISPAINITEDCKLLITMAYYGSSYNESIRLCYGSEASVSAMTNVIIDRAECGAQDYADFGTIEAKAGQTIYLGVQCYSAANLWRLFLGSIKVEATDVVVDLRTTTLTAPKTGPELSSSEQVSFFVENIGLDPVENFSVEVYVGDEMVFSEVANRYLDAGDAIEYTCQNTVDLSIPRNVYMVTAVVRAEGEVSYANNSVSAKVYHQADAFEPYFTGFEPDEINDGHMSFNLNEDSGNWGVEVGYGWFSMARTGYGYIGYNYDKTNSGDDWFIIEGIKVEAGYHALKFWYSGDDNHAERFSVWWGTEQTPEAMTNKIVEYNPFQRSAYEQSISIFEVDEPQTIYIGFYAFSDPDENWITIDDFSLEKIEATDADLQIVGISNPGDYVPEIGVKDVIVDIKCSGVQEQNISVVVSIDDNVVGSQQLTIAAQEQKTLTFTDALTNLALGSHNLKVEVVCENDFDPENNVVEKTFVYLGDPDIFYGFEENAIPGGILFKDNNSATLASGAIAEFGETGWCPVHLGDNHYLLGDYVLGGSTWINGADNADRYCILPRVRVGEGDSYFLWSTSQLSPSYAESYEIRGNDNADPYYFGWYDKLYSETLNDGLPKYNRGVSLNRYAGKDIYIAIRMTTGNGGGDAMMFDNLSIYNCQFTDAGVDSVENGDESILSIHGDILSVSGNGAQVKIYDASGRLVISAEANIVNVAGLAKGVYVVSASSDSGVATVKIAR